MEELIKKLRAEGKKYEEIKNELNCSFGTISHYLTEDGKAKTAKRKEKYRNIRRKGYREKLGSKCQVCGYNKCLSALHFHHIDPKAKKFPISEVMTGGRKRSEQEIEEEIKKCVLVCANCHTEIHAGLITIVKKESLHSDLN